MFVITSIQEYNSDYDFRIRFFCKSIGDDEWLYGIAQNLLRIDLVKDERFSSTVLSHTIFNHSIFASELTSMHSGRWGKHRKGGAADPRFNLHTFLSLSDKYKNSETFGYISEEKAATIADLLEKGTTYGHVELYRGLPHNRIEIEGDVAAVTIDLREPSLEAKQSHRRDMEEYKRESEHPEGKYYQKLQEAKAEWKKEDSSKTEEEKAQVEEWEEVWKRKTREALGDKPLVEEVRNEIIQINLEGLSTGGISDLLASMVGGFRLRSSEDFRRVFNFYTSVYESFVKSFCAMEKMQPPRSKVLLGSYLIAS